MIIICYSQLFLLKIDPYEDKSKEYDDDYDNKILSDEDVFYLNYLLNNTLV